MKHEKRDLGIVFGRYNDFHIGHESLVDVASDFCDRVLIVVGSSQEQGTERNPYSIATRMEMIREVYPDKNKFIIRCLADMTHEDDVTPEWGKYVIAHVKEMAFKTPDLMVYGNDEARQRWFDKSDISWMDIMIPRSIIPISATMMREAMVKDDRDMWMKYHNPKLHKHYGRLREELLATKYYRDMFNGLLKPKELKPWTDKGV